MKRFAIGIFLIAGAVLFAATADAQRLALHVQAKTDVKVCTKNAPSGTCDTYTTEVPAGTSAAPIDYTVYLTLVMDTVANPNANGGIIGCGFGIDYEPYVNNGGTKTGSLVSAFTNCGDLGFEGEGWPGDHTGITVTWLACQQGASVPDNVQAIIGALQVKSYSPDKFQIIPRPANGRIEINGCPPPDGGANLDIPSNKVGFITFAAAAEQGCNPCVAPFECDIVATEPRTWGKIKQTFGGE